MKTEKKLWIVLITQVLIFIYFSILGKEEYIYTYLTISYIGILITIGMFLKHRFKENKNENKI
jgi:hypothetical protein